MNIPVMTIDKAAARKAFLEYRDAVRARHSKEDEAIMRGYCQMSRGKQLIDLHEVMRATGVDELNRPKLAIVRADARWCFYECYSVPQFRATDRRFGYGTKSMQVNLPENFFPRLWQESRRNNTLRAVVPIIPPALRPAHALSNYHILWEAEWEVVPTDPILLKHVGGALYAVLASWDLTPLERSVLSGRLTNS